jgi:hypothetical protein
VAGRVGLAAQWRSVPILGGPAWATRLLEGGREQEAQQGGRGGAVRRRIVRAADGGARRSDCGVLRVE